MWCLVVVRRVREGDEEEEISFLVGFCIGSTR